MYDIYKHTNTLSGKCYIGKSKHGISKRWEGHVLSALRGSELHLHRAIRCYPLDSWTHEVLETVETNQEANLCESKWIMQLHSNDSDHGYNMTKGGDGGQTASFERLSELGKRPKSLKHRESMRESQERYWEDNPDDTRRQQLAERNASPEMVEAARQAQVRRWSKPGARAAMQALWADPTWRAKTLEARRQARLKK